LNDATKVGSPPGSSFTLYFLLLAMEFSVCAKKEKETKAIAWCASRFFAHILAQHASCYW